MTDEADKRVWPDDDVILYDGHCALCSGWVRFVVKRDAAARFRFTPISSPYGTAMSEVLGIDPADPDTNAVIVAGRALRRSDAAIAVLSALPWWGWTRIWRICPRSIRDAVYAAIASRRYRLFGRHDVCDTGDSDFRDRVILVIER